MQDLDLQNYNIIAISINGSINSFKKNKIMTPN